MNANLSSNQNHMSSPQPFDKNSKNLKNTANAILSKNTQISATQKPQQTSPTQQQNRNLSEAERQLISSSGQFGYNAAESAQSYGGLNNSGQNNHQQSANIVQSTDKRSASRASNHAFQGDYGQLNQQQSPQIAQHQKDFMGNYGFSNSMGPTQGTQFQMQNQASNLNSSINDKSYLRSDSKSKDPAHAQSMKVTQGNNSQQQYTSLMQLNSSVNNNSISKHGAQIILGMNPQNNRINSSGANTHNQNAMTMKAQQSMPVPQGSIHTSQSPQITTKKIFMNSHELSGQQSHKILQPMTFPENKTGLPMNGNIQQKPKIEKVSAASIQKKDNFDNIKPISITKDQINFVPNGGAKQQAQNIVQSGNQGSNSDLFNVQNSPLSTSPSPNATSPLTKGIQNLGLTLTKDAGNNLTNQRQPDGQQQQQQQQQDAQLKNRTAAISKEMDNFLSNF